MENIVIGIMAGFVGLVCAPLGAYILATSRPSKYQWHFGKSPEEQAFRDAAMSLFIMLGGLGILIYLGNQIWKAGWLNWLF